MGFTGNDGSALAGGLNPSGVVQALQVDALGNLSIEDMVRLLTMKGNAYSATTDKLVAPGVATLGFQLFAPANNTKNILIYSLIIANTGAGIHRLFKTAANVNTITGWTDVASIITNNGANAAASTATSSYSNTNVTGGLLGSAREISSNAGYQAVECLTNGECIWLPAGAASIAGIALYFGAAGANAYGITCEYLEF